MDDNYNYILIDGEKWVLKRDKEVYFYEFEEGSFIGAEDFEHSYEEFLDANNFYAEQFKNVNVDSYKLFIEENILSWSGEELSAKKNNLKVLEEKLKAIENTFCFKLTTKDLNNETLNKLTKLATKVLADGKQVKIVVNEPITKKDNSAPVEYIYISEQMNKIKSLNNYLKKKGMEKPVAFAYFFEPKYHSDYDDCWCFDTVLKANNFVDNLAIKIKEKNLSPFESILYIHSFITENFEMTDFIDEVDNLFNINVKVAEKGRVIPDILQNKNIVCAGFASLVKAVVDKLNFKDLKCEILGSNLFQKGDESYENIGGHCNNLIYIKDEKYNIDGYYMEDASWDAKEEDFENGKGFAYCLYPIADLEKIEEMYFVQHNEKSRLKNLMFNQDEISKNIIDEEISEKEELLKQLKNREKDSPIDFDLIDKILNETNINKQAMRNKKEVEYGVDILKEGKNSPAIPKKTYKEGLVSLYQKLYGKVSKANYEKILRSLTASEYISSSGFEKDADSEFNKNYKYVIQKHLKRESSFKKIIENDMSR